MFGMPANLSSSLDEALFLIENTNEPLACMQVFDWCATALMRSNVVFYHLLMQYRAFISKML